MEVPLSLRNTENARRAGPTMKCLADFRVEKEIGEGSFSTVYLAREKDGEKRKVALKVCMKKHIIKNRMIVYIQREKDVMALLSRRENFHPSVVSLYCTFQDNESLYFVLSYAKYGDLGALTRNQPKARLKLEDARYYAANLIEALAHIHSLGIIHRDVKADNILVKEDGRILLSDFGSAKFLKDYDDEEKKGKKVEEERQPMGRRKSFTGTAQYCTPELLEGRRMYASVDIWSFGVTLFFFLTGLLAFDDVSEYLVFKRVQELLYKFPDDFPDETAKDLIEKVLVVKEEDRLTSDQIRRHKFFKSYNFEHLEQLEPPKLLEIDFSLPKEDF